MGKLYDGVLRGKATASECHLAINVKLFAVAYCVNDEDAICSVLVSVHYFCAARR